MRAIAEWWRRLWSPCWFGHQPRVWECGGPGACWVLVCPRCRHLHQVRL
jgi:hypothetical protein